MWVYGGCNLWVSVQPETGDRSAQISTGRVGAMRCCVARAEVSCKSTVAETSKLMQCECELYDSECEKHKAMICTHSTIASAGHVDAKAASSILRHCTDITIITGGALETIVRGPA